MHNRVLAVVIAVICAVVMISGCAPAIIKSKAGPSYLFGENLTDEQFKAKIDSGEIPQNVTFMDLSFNEISDLTTLTSHAPAYQS